MDFPRSSSQRMLLVASAICKTSMALGVFWVLVLVAICKRDNISIVSMSGTCNRLFS